MGDCDEKSNDMDGTEMLLAEPYRSRILLPDNGVREHRYASEVGMMEEEVSDLVCPFTGGYCTGLHCEDYGCAKQCGVFDGEEE